MSAWRDAEVLEVSVMTAIKVAVLRLTSAQDYGRVAATMMRFPTASFKVATAVLPDKFLSATLTVAPYFVESSLYLVRTELVIVRHRLKKRQSS